MASANLFTKSSAGRLPAAFALLAATWLASLWLTPAAATEHVRPSTPAREYFERNNRGELSYWHHGNVTGRALLPFAGRLAVGGGFTHAGGVESPGVAFWNGSNWEAAGSEMFDNWVYSLAVYDGRLFAGGHFTRYGSEEVPHIARLDAGGTDWTPLSGGFPNNDVWAMVPFTTPEGEEVLIAGGQFNEVGGVPVHAVACWNGAVWSPMGDGLTWQMEPGVTMTGTVYALYVFGGELYAGGGFTNSGAAAVNHFAKWNGVSWEAVNEGFNAPVMAIGEYDGDLVVGGHFTMSGDGMAFHLACFRDGTWQTYGLPWEVANGAVFAITQYAGHLAIGGEFNEAGGQDCSYVARWNGHDWMPFGAGVDDNRVFGLCPYGERLIATGGFLTSHDVLVNRIAAWPEPDPPHGHWVEMDGGLTGALIGAGSGAGAGLRSLGGWVAPELAVPVAERAAGLRVRPQPDGVHQVLFYLPQAGLASVDLLDIGGRLVSRLAAGPLEAGPQALLWEVAPQGSGCYFLRLRAPGVSEAVRVLLVH